MCLKEVTSDHVLQSRLWESSISMLKHMLCQLMQMQGLLLGMTRKMNNPLWGIWCIM